MLLAQGLTFIDEASAVVFNSGSEALSFTEATTWSRSRLSELDQGLSFYEHVTYNTTSGASGGSGYVTPPVLEEPQPKLTVGAFTFRITSSYEIETTFGNGTYLNAGDKYSLTLGRPLDVVGDWQLQLRALIGTKQTITNLLPLPFEAFIIDETVLDSEGMSLVFLNLEHDTRGAL